MSPNNRDDIGLDPKPSEVHAKTCIDFSGFGSDQFWIKDKASLQNYPCLHFLDNKYPLFMTHTYFIYLVFLSCDTKWKQTNQKTPLNLHM